jgi:hypothetical protein
MQFKLKNMDPNLQALANVYMRHYAQGGGCGDFWAWEQVQDLVRSGFSQAWPIVQALIERADSEGALNYVAAGPLEDFVDGYGDAALDVIEAACETDQKMQLALSGIWLERESRVLMRWQELMKRFGFMGGTRKPLSTHPDCWL